MHISCSFKLQFLAYIMKRVLHNSLVANKALKKRIHSIELCEIFQISKSTKSFTGKEKTNYNSTSNCLA